MIEIRPETPADFAAVHALTARAFGRAAEADLNDRLRENGKAVLSLVATQKDEVVGHVMFAPVTLSTCGIQGVSLGPICVEEGFRGRKIMRRLVEAGLAGVREKGYDFAMLLGSPALYPRFGFAQGIDFGLKSDYDVRDDEFMVLELWEGSLGGVSGTARFAPEFRDA